MTSLDRIKKGDIQAKYSGDYFSLDRIAKLITSTSDSIEKFLTKEALLKIMKSMLTNNTLVIKRITGKTLGTIINNESLKKAVCVREQINGKPTSSYQELL